jgi:hypothetical protein
METVGGLIEDDDVSLFIFGDLSVSDIERYTRSLGTLAGNPIAAHADHQTDTQKEEEKRRAVVFRRAN